MQEDTIRLDAELHRVEDQLAAAKRTMEDLLREEADSARRREDLSLVVQEAAQAQADLSKESASWQERLNALTGGRDELTRNREELGERCSALRMAQMATEKDIESIRANLDELARRQEDSTGNIGRIEGEIAEVDERTRQQEERIASLRPLGRRSCGSRPPPAGIASRSKQRDRQTLEQTIHQIRSSERENMEKRERLGSEIARLEERRDALSRESEEIVAKLYDEYSLTRSEAEAMGVDVGERAAASRRLG